MLQLLSLCILLCPGSGLAFETRHNLARIILAWCAFLFLLVVTRLIVTPPGVMLVGLSLVSLHVLGVIRAIQNRNTVWTGFRYAYAPAISAFFVAVLVAIFLLRVSLLGVNLYYIPSKSMTPTLVPGDIVLVDTWHHLNDFPAEREVVVFSKNDLTFIKRIKSVDSNYVRVEGDNILASLSSEQIGKVPISRLRGKATLILFNTVQFSVFRILRRVK